VSHGAAALAPATGTAAFADAGSPALQLPLCPGQALHLPPGEVDRTWGPLTVPLPNPPRQGLLCLRVVPSYPSCSHLQRPYIEVLHRLGDIKLVHSGDDDSRGGEEEEEDEEDHVDHEAADPPDEAPDGEVFPGRGKGGHQDG